MPTLAEEFNDYWDIVKTPKVEYLEELLRVTFYAGAIAALTVQGAGTSMEALVAQISASKRDLGIGGRQ